MSQTIKILNAEPKGYCQVARDILNSLGELTEKEMDCNELKSCVEDYDVLIVRLKSQIDKTLLDRAGRLKYIISATTGLDHIDEEYAGLKGITILSLRGEIEFLKTIRATAELTVGLALSLLRSLPRATAAVLEGCWNRDQFQGRELYGKTLGILGMGRLGQIVSNYFQAFGMNIIAYDNSTLNKTKGVHFVPKLEDLLQECDLLSIHLPLNRETRNMLGKRELELMKPSAALINTSRGAIVKEQDLVDALASGVIAGAAIDVMENEWGVNAHRPLIQYARENNNLLITPHIGGNTAESFEKTEIFLAEKLAKELSYHD